MKTKLVIWGQKGAGENTENVLLALELLAEDNKIKALVFEAEAASKELEEELMEKWRKAEAMVLPENHKSSTYELSAGGSLLPAGIGAGDKEDLVKRTQTEWLFIVLSTKLFKTYVSELEELKDRVEALTKYNKGLWEEMKSFQSKVMAQVKEQNLFREHTQFLRDRVNDLFSILKELRRVEDEAFEREAKANSASLEEGLLEVEQALEQNAGNWPQCFDKLKGLQNRLKKMKLTREDRSKLWDRIDKAFKAVKVKRFGDTSTQSNRLERRMDGLSKAIQKMEKSIARDEKELEFQNKKMNSSHAGQLEAQLREVKAKLIVERIESKKEKLTDMQQTMEDLKQRLEKLNKRLTAQEAKAKEQPTEQKTEQKEAPEDILPKAAEVKNFNKILKEPAVNEEILKEQPKEETSTETKGSEEVEASTEEQPKEEENALNPEPGDTEKPTDLEEGVANTEESLKEGEPTHTESSETKEVVDSEDSASSEIETTSEEEQKED